MTVANRLYDRPHDGSGSPVNFPALYLTGAFATAAAGQAYRGVLAIHNAIGTSRVDLLSGNLPPGYVLSVDNAAQLVVLTWPAYQTNVVSIPNANFAAGDDGSWELTSGWSIMQGVTAPDPNDPGNNWQAQFANQGGQSQMTHHMRADVTPGQAITASCDVQQGASSANAAGAAVRLQFEDGAGNVVGTADGNVVKSGSNSEWNTSTLNASTPTGASKVRMACAAFRARQNEPLWVDHFTWNLSQAAQGTNSPKPIPLSLRVTDGAGRTADWSGVIAMLPAPTALGYWKCDETSGTVLHDSSGNNRNGVIVVGAGIVPGSAPLWSGSTGSLGTTAQVNKAASIDLSSVLNASTYQNWSVECLARSTNPATNSETILAFNAGSSSKAGEVGLYAFPDTPNRLAAFLESGGGIGQDFRLNDSPPLANIQQVNHLLLTRAGNAGALYINGVLKASNASASWATMDTTLRLLGCDAYPSSYGVIGQISDVAFYSADVGYAFARLRAKALGQYRTPTITPSSVGLSQGDTVQLVAVGLASAVAWVQTSGQPNLLVDGNGVLSCPTGTANGTYNVGVRCVDPMGDSATATIPLTVAADPYISYVKSLLHFNSGLTDTFGIAWTNVGSNWSPQPTGGKFAGYLQNTGAGGASYLSTADTRCNLFGVAAWTVDMWVRWNGTNTFGGLLFVGNPGSNTNRLQLQSNNGSLSVYTESGSYATSAWVGPLTANVWCQVRISYDGSQIYLFINGTLVLNYIPTGLPTSGYINTLIGTLRSGGSLALPFPGDITEARITVGACRSTTNYKIPSAPFPDS